ncbi:MAG: hypothetical protein H5T73_03625 [Actinobacteria bacterium]|nr:hypothetical protein [Actinomycetota bacterium]
MTTVKGNAVRVLVLLSVFLSLSIGVVACGAGDARDAGIETSRKLPPGMTEEELEASDSSPATTAGTMSGEGASGYTASGNTTGDNPSTGGSATDTDTNSTAVTSTAKSVTLSGTGFSADFTVVAAKRQDNNRLVSSSGQREVSGDFLEIELAIKNSGDSLLDLSRFSFRLWSPYITASAYDDYYGNVTTYGGYVARNIVSAALLDYASLQKVAYTLRVGEEVGDVFLFYDLNPLSVSANQGFTKEGANLIIYDTETGNKVEVNLAGFAD